jgi:alpha-D-ribose 1-methylphosphonate 5-triphosphate synthase subunit PhnI
VPAVVIRAGCEGISEVREVSEAYKQLPGHQYAGKTMGRGHRQRSKIMKALNGVASLALIDEVMREDRQRVFAMAPPVRNLFEEGK